MRGIAASAFRLRRVSGLAYAPTTATSRRLSKFATASGSGALPVCSTGRRPARTPTWIAWNRTTRFHAASSDPAIRVGRISV